MNRVFRLGTGLVLSCAYCITQAAEPLAAANGGNTDKRDGKPEEVSQVSAKAIRAVPYVTDEVLQSIVREAFSAQVVVTANKDREHDRFTAAQRKVLDERFESASTPVCLHENGLKLQSTSIGPIIFTGLMQLPMALVAPIQGKCKF